MIKPEDYNSLMVFQAGSHKTVTSKFKNINKDFTSLGNLLKGSRWKGCSVLFNLPSWRLRSGQKEENQPAELMAAWIVSHSGLWLL